MKECPARYWKMEDGTYRDPYHVEPIELTKKRQRKIFLVQHLLGWARYVSYTHLYLEKLFYKYQNHQLIYSNNTDKFYEDTKQYLETIGVNDLSLIHILRVRTYKTVKINGKSIRIYSGWSKAKAVTTKK